MSSMSKLWTTLGLSLLMDEFTWPFLQPRLLRYWPTRNPPAAANTATGTATTRCSGKRETEVIKQFNTAVCLMQGSQISQSVARVFLGTTDCVGSNIRNTTQFDAAQSNVNINYALQNNHRLLNSSMTVSIIIEH